MLIISKQKLIRVQPLMSLLIIDSKACTVEHYGSLWFSSIWFSFNIENWKSKLHNRDFQCLILKNWKSKIYNLSFQCLLLRKVKLNIILQYFENQKLKIENGQLVVLTFCFQFPPPKIQAIKNLNLTKQFMCSKFCKKRCYCWWNPK